MALTNQPDQHPIKSHFLRTVGRVLMLTATTLCVTACQSPFEAFYTGTTAEIENKAGRPVSVLNEPVQVIETSNIEQELAFRAQSGLFVLGYANWNGPQVGSAAEAREQAKRVGASTVLWSWSYAGSSSGTLPMTTPTSTTTYGSGVVYGAGGSASWSGSATSYGTSTTYIPYTIHRYNVSSVFMARSLYKPILGVVVRLPVPSEQAIAGTVGGLLVETVEMGSPAALGGVLPYDTLCRIEDLSVNSLDDLSAATRRYAGRMVSVELRRRGTLMKLSISLNAEQVRR